MPRVTRAQLRAQAEGGPQVIHEDFDGSPTAEHHEYDPFSTETSTRPPLAEIYGNSTPGPELVQAEEESIVSNTNGSKRGKALKKNKSNLILRDNGNCPRDIRQEVLEDKQSSDTSSAPSVATKKLRKEPLVESFQVQSDVPRSRTPPCAAAKETNKSSGTSPQSGAFAVPVPAAKTPKFDPVVHTEMSSTGQAAESNEDSFVGSIKKRTPARIVDSQDPTGEGPDSFVGDIISRSPSKYAARIEDSVEAMDALEEAIEQVSEELPKAIAEGMDPPVKTGTTKAIAPRTSLRAQRQKPSAKSSPPAGKSTEPAASAKSSASTTTVSLPSKVKSRTTALRVSSAQPPPHPSARTNFKRASPSDKVAASAGDAEHSQSTAARPPTTATNRTSSTTLSTSKPGFVPTKSAKPPTKSTFTLPGAAVSAKQKAQREERRKKEEAEAEAARKRTEFKARPVPKAVTAFATEKGRNSSLFPRETLATKARMSMMAAKKENEEGKENASPALRKTSGSSAGSTKVASSAARKSVMPLTNQSGLSVTQTRTGAPSAAGVASRADKSTVPANSSAVRRNTTSYATLPKTRRSSVQTRAPLHSSGPDCEGLQNIKPTAATAKTTATRATSKGKEVFSRGKIAEEELLNQKREKEEAARRARVEAAERGRLASREWAEKQRKRKTTMMLTEGETRLEEDGKAVTPKDAMAKGARLSKEGKGAVG